MNQRVKLYGIAIPVFLIITLIGGSLAYIGGEAYREAYFIAGAELGYNAGARAGYYAGWQQGAMEGYYYGVNEGYYYGYLDGKMETYVRTVLEYDNPYHIAALEFEKKHLGIDITDIQVFPGAEDESDTIVVILAMPLYFDTEGEIWRGIYFENLEPEVIADLQLLVTNIQNGEEFVKFVLLGTVDTYTPYYYYLYDRCSFAIADFLNSNFSRIIRTDDDLAVQENFPSAVFMKGSSSWPWNPYRIEAIQSGVDGAEQPESY
jgi:hypothetical protein